jgi:Probable cobalt transporter subunit (CbtB)
MEKTVGLVRGVAVPEYLSFLIKSAFFLLFSGVILYLLLAATYPPIHDTVHHFRHSLAIVPCH